VPHGFENVAKNKVPPGFENVAKYKVPPGFENVANSQQPHVAIKEEDRDDVVSQYNHRSDECRECHEELHNPDKDDYVCMEAMSQAMVTGLCGWE
jgi:hypothetical protein